MPKMKRGAMQTGKAAGHRKIRLTIIFGGRSAEHDVSIASAASVIRALDRSDFEISVMGITRDGNIATLPQLHSMLPEDLHSRVFCLQSIEGIGNNIRVSNQHSIVQNLSAQEEPQVVFPLLHGPYGEDGTIQGLLEVVNLPYIGCGVLASAAGMDKDFMKRIFIQAGLPVAQYRTVLSRNLDAEFDFLKEWVRQELGYPVFSKPANLGSSVGIRKIHDESEFEDALRFSAQFDRKVLIEKGIDARELECAVLGNDDPEVSVVGEVFSAHEFYDYAAKYVNRESRIEIPARLERSKAEEIRMLALQSFKAIDGSGLARVDFFMEKSSGRVWVNEINTMPGFTPISMYAKLWSASGVPFARLVRKLVALAEERFRERAERKTCADPVSSQ